MLQILSTEDHLLFVRSKVYSYLVQFQDKLSELIDGSIATRNQLAGPQRTSSEVCILNFSFAFYPRLGPIQKSKMMTSKGENYEGFNQLFNSFEFKAIV